MFEASPENIALAKRVALEGFRERTKERGRQEPVDLSGACKFSSLFAQRLFGGELRGNHDHQFVVLPGGRRLDLTEGSAEQADFARRGIDPFRQDDHFWGNPEHLESLASCGPRVDSWAERFVQAEARAKRFEIDRLQNAEATEFALCLLMPEEAVAEAFQKIKRSPPEVLVKKLAKQFEVSIPVMSLRLFNLGLIQP